MKTKKPIRILVGMFCGMTALGALGAWLGSDFDLSWHTVDAGGGYSAGGDFDVEGTIGQPDAGEMSGGEFTLIGGFWTGASSGGGCTRDPAWVCDGDVDGNGAVNPVDVGLIQAAFCSPELCTDADLCQYDIDCNGAINPIDAGLSQSLFGTCDPPRTSCD
jgi:hypothetical protein